MPTSKPRISITVDADDLAVLDRYAAASGKPRASLIAELLKATVPEIARAARLMEIANNATPEMLRKVSRDLGEATEQALGKLIDVDRTFQGLARRVSHRVEWAPVPGSGRGAVGDAAASPAAPRSRRRGSDPHLLTGGSK